MQNESEDDDPVAMRMRNGTASAAQTVTASVAELTRKVDQTEAQLRNQLRLNLLLVVINLATLIMVYLYAGRPPVGVGGGQEGQPPFGGVGGQEGGPVGSLPPSDEL